MNIFHATRVGLPCSFNILAPAGVINVLSPNEGSQNLTEVVSTIHDHLFKREKNGRPLTYNYSYLLPVNVFFRMYYKFYYSRAAKATKMALLCSIC